ncbi:DUF6907 domain-containing protein [Streptomyces ossamyceticus]|uniref:DUF6907 domain-containing protein n=1 Tax=Streptomyces ossamyceticus TaxID=249581 RepID=UPI0036E674C1
MSARRTVTLATIDHGDVTIPEPTWCAGHDAHVPVHRSDLTHYGPVTGLAFRGAVLHRFRIGQAPFAELDTRAVGGELLQESFAASVTPADLDAFAAALVEHAAVLRHQARKLAALLVGGAQ